MDTMLADDFLLGHIDGGGKHYTADNEFELRICSHHGNCPCAGRLVTVTIDYYVFADDSVYVDGLGLERTFRNDDDMWEWFINSDEANEAVAYNQ